MWVPNLQLQDPGDEYMLAARNRPMALQPGLVDIVFGHASLITLLLSGKDAGLAFKS